MFAIRGNPLDIYSSVDAHPFDYVADGIINRLRRK